MGAAGTTGLDAVLSMTALMLALMGAGYAVQAIGVLRAEETSAGSRRGSPATAVAGPG